MAGRRLLVLLEEREDKMVKAMARYTGLTQAQLIRWAIRFYALQGPWMLRGKKERAAVIGPTEPMKVGPMMMEEME